MFRNSPKRPRCGVVVEVIRKATRDLVSAEDDTESADGLRGGCGRDVL